MSNQHKSLSKFLSFILRHQPGAIGIALDQNGWVSVEDPSAFNLRYVNRVRVKGDETPVDSWRSLDAWQA